MVAQLYLDIKSPLSLIMGVQVIMLHSFPVSRRIGLGEMLANVIFTVECIARVDDLNKGAYQCKWGSAKLPSFFLDGAAAAREAVVSLDYQLHFEEERRHVGYYRSLSARIHVEK